MPDERARNGDFSHFFNSNGTLQRIGDPFTGVRVAPQFALTQSTHNMLAFGPNDAPEVIPALVSGVVHGDRGTSSP